jgi:hypothetical protein
MKMIIFVAVIAAGVVFVILMPKSKKRFWWEIIRQTPYLIQRYFV